MKKTTEENVNASLRLTPKRGSNSKCVKEGGGKSPHRNTSISEAEP